MGGAEAARGGVRGEGPIRTGTRVRGEASRRVRRHNASRSISGSAPRIIAPTNRGLLRWWNAGPILLSF